MLGLIRRRHHYWSLGRRCKRHHGAYGAGRVNQGNIKLEGAEKAQSKTARRLSKSAQSMRRRYVQHLFAVFFGTLAFAFVEPFFFIGLLISIVSSVIQAIFMATRGVPGTNAKKIVERNSRKRDRP